MEGQTTTFEAAYRQLEAIVQKLETGGLPLEENIALFEEGMRLARLCGRQLEAAELRIVQLTSGFDREPLGGAQDGRPGLTEQ